MHNSNESQTPFSEKPSLNIGLNSFSLFTSEGESLPHWNCDNAIYHVSFRLFDSVPKSKRDEWLKERESNENKIKNLNRELTEKELKEIQYLYSDRIESFLDSGYGECYLVKPEIADLVVNALQYFEGQRYFLHAWCVMPNHVHVIVEPLVTRPSRSGSVEKDNDHIGVDQVTLSKIIHSWKSYIAHKANKILNRRGDFWQHDYYNHIIRSHQSYLYQIRYIWDNPENAGFKNWSSRWKKKQQE